MASLREILERALSAGTLVSVSLSKSLEENAPSIKVRAIAEAKGLAYQASWIADSKAFHKNFQASELAAYVLSLFPGTYRQCVLNAKTAQYQFLADRKGKVHTVINKQEFNPAITHNKQKQYLIPEGKPVPWLAELGVMNASGMVAAKYYDKFRQINRFLEFIDASWGVIEGMENPVLVDFGCGKSYLTFAMHHYFSAVRKKNVRMTGLDLKADVIEFCGKLAEKYRMEGLRFVSGDIAGYDEISRADVVVCLHACDTATDYALSKAVLWGASLILAVPCCHKELIHKIEAPELSEMTKHGIVRERLGSLVTDTMRALALEARGYKATIMEFIATEHTPKNILIKAQKIVDSVSAAETEARQREAMEKLRSFTGFWNVEPCCQSC